MSFGIHDGCHGCAALSSYKIVHKVTMQNIHMQVSKIMTIRAYETNHNRVHINCIKKILKVEEANSQANDKEE